MTGSTEAKSSTPRMVIFDSGVGGLSIYEEMRLLLAPAEYIYCSDNAFFPYGLKTEAVVTERVVAIGEALIEKFKPDLYVVACNTASVVALEHLRQKVSIPVVGVVPAIKPAAATSASKVIGLLATPVTVKRPYTDDLIQKFAADTEVIKVGSSRLVSIAEDFLRGLPVDTKAIAAEIKPLFVGEGERKTDTVVLGCTHFPLLVDFFAKLAPWPVRWLDSGPAIASRVKTLLPQLAGPRGECPAGTAVFTKADATQKALLPVLTRLNLRTHTVISVGSLDDLI